MMKIFPARLLGICALACWALLCVVTASKSQSEIERRDFFVTSDPGVQIFVREVVFARGVDPNGRPPILLLHGARVPGLASFDLPVPGGSFAADLAQLGFDVFLMDVRGYGGSSRPKEMDEAPNSHAPVVRSNEAARDVSAVET